MKESEIKKHYNSKLNELNKHNKNYFDKNSPTISDKEYDKIKLEVIGLEKKYTFLKNPYSPSRSLGYPPSKNFVKSDHR